MRIGVVSMPALLRSVNNTRKNELVVGWPAAISALWMSRGDRAGGTVPNRMGVAIARPARVLAEKMSMLIEVPLGVLATYCKLLQRA